MSNDHFAWWRAAMAGNRESVETAQCGYFRVGNRACSIYMHAGELVAWVSDGFCPRTKDQIDEAFRHSWQQYPISYEVFAAFRETGRWPEQPAPVAVEHADDAPEHEKIKAEIEAVGAAAKEWLASLPNGISNDTEDGMAANYAKKLADLTKRAEDTRADQKKPILEAGRKIDGTWKPVVDLGETTRKAILAPTTEYRRKRAAEEAKARAAEEARLREEARKHAAETNAPVVPPVTLPPKKPTGLRTVKVVEITSLQALAAQLASWNEPDEEFVETCRKIARKLLTAGVKVEGARLIDEQRAA
jgi:hypothetical protein